MEILDQEEVIEKKAVQLVVLPKESLEAIYAFLLTLPAKDVLEVLKHFSEVKLAEET
jgi:hypothetical protein